MLTCRSFWPGIGALAAACLPAAAVARDDSASPSTVAIEAEYKLDTVALVHGPREGVRRVDYLSLAADVSLDKAVGWKGARLFVHGIAATGGEPNLLAGTLQGINNIEVVDNRVRLFQAYLEQDLAVLPGSLLVGLSDLNAEFYVNDAAALLIAPAFGIGSELSASGPNGPSIFPSTALAARLKLEAGRHGYAQFGVFNAEAGVPGERGGIRKPLDKGALLIGEAGWMGRGKLAAGIWTYTRKQDDIRLTGPHGAPVRQRARGGYVLVEQPLVERGDASVIAFARAGVSDGRTTPFSGGWQAGLLATGVLPGRPAGQLSLGLNQAFLSARYRGNAADAGEPAGRRETGLELTYADALAPWLSLQPDFQYVWNASRDPDARNAAVLTLRITLTPPTP